MIGHEYSGRRKKKDFSLQFTGYTALLQTENIFYNSEVNNWWKINDSSVGKFQNTTWKVKACLLMYVSLIYCTHLFQIC